MRHHLDNGLTLVLQEHHAARVVAFQAWVNAGSADEAEAESGLAHLHEHMLFKGTRRRGAGRIAREVEAAGGDINAWTGLDQTVFHLVMASRDFDVGLDIVADALREPAFHPDQLAREQLVILEELRRTYDRPERRASRHLFDLAYQAHPYRRPTLGREETVRGFTREDVLRFYRRHYRPHNVTLVLAGDFEEADALARIERLFGDWRPAPVAAAEGPRRAEPIQRELRARVREEDLQEAWLQLAWHIPGLTHPDVPALDVAAVILGQGVSSRLVGGLRRRRQLVNAIQSYAHAPRDPGLLFVTATCGPGQVEVSLRETLRAAHRLRDGRPSEDELEKAKTIIESDGVYQHETVEGQARRLGFFQSNAGNPRFEQEYYRRVRRVTAEDVRQVLQTYVGTDRLTVAALVPRGTGVSEGRVREVALEADRRRRPRRTDGRDGVLRTRLTSGATLLIQPDPQVPLVSLRGVWVGGLRHETEADNGISQLMSRLLTGSTESRSGEEVARLADEWAAAVQGLAGRNSFGLGGEFLARHLERGVRLFTECLTTPAFLDREVEAVRAQQAEAVRVRDDDPAGSVFGLFGQARWQRHPYRLDPLGTLESLSRLDGAALREAHRRRHPLSRLHLAVVGDVDPDRVRELLEERLPLREAAPEAPPPDPPLDPSPDAPVRVERHLDKAQTHLLLGYPGVRLSDADRYPLEVLAAVLSGGTGRLFAELRERRGLAYTLGATSVEGLDPGYFGVFLSCAPARAEEAVEAVRAELAAACETPVDEAALERVKRYLVGTHEIGLQRAGHRAAVMAFDEAYGLGWDSHLSYARRIAAVGPRDVLEAARRHLDPRREVLAVVGPSAER